MRLQRLSLLAEVPSGHGLPARLGETIVAACSAAIAHRLYGSYADPACDSASAAFAMLFALGVLTGLRKANSTPPRDVSLHVLVWFFSEAIATLAVRAMHPEYAPTPAWFLCWSALTTTGTIAVQCVFHVAGAQTVRTRSVAVVGRGANCSAFIRGFETMRDSPYRIDALFDLNATADAALSELHLFHDDDAFVAHVRAQRIDELWLALPLTDEETLLRFLDIFRNDLLNIRFLPDVGALTRFRGKASELDAALAINLVAAPLTAKALVIKGIFDRVFAACAVLALSPVFVVVAAAIRATSPGPVLFRQWRHGANGESFQIYKFRTMHVHASDGAVVVQATRNDPRITRIGAFLRRTSLDELPQFFNVLRGEMSVVGPRPHAIEHDKLYQNIVDGYIHRYRIKPGITGWAQINGLRGETDSIEKMERRVEHDLFYLSNWSFGLDMRIVLLTVVRGFVHRNAY